jgi:hypothetical protein
MLEEDKKPAAPLGSVDAGAAINKPMVMDRNDKNEDHFNGDFSLEESPCYEILNTHKLLTTEYRVSSVDELALSEPNSSRAKNSILESLLCLTCTRCFYNGFEVPNGTIKKVYDGRGNYYFCGPGVHLMLDLYTTVTEGVVPIADTWIVHGDRTIVTVNQGFIGYCMERGQPVLLPPGLHQWKNPVLKFERLIDLNQPVIELGPWTLLTIDQGYMAVTQDNGQQVILDGGSVYLLTRKFIFILPSGWTIH